MDSSFSIKLELKDLSVKFKTDDGNLLAVNKINLQVPASKTLCIVGESGCGKSVTVSSILKLHDPDSSIIEGEIIYHQDDKGIRQINEMHSKSKAMQEIRGNQISMIFQESMTALSPVHTVGDQICEMMILHEKLSLREASERTIALLEKVGIPSPRKRFNLYPFQLSGGMRQRVMIAMALSCNPQILIADEPTTALDVTTQSQILFLLKELQDEYGMTTIFITHDLGVVGEIADYVGVMYLGEMVEYGDVYTIFENPVHPYTKDLLASIPTIDREWNQRLNPIEGSVPSLNQRPNGCCYHPRCLVRKKVCENEVPKPYIDKTNNHKVSCVLADSIFQRDVV